MDNGGAYKYFASYWWRLKMSGASCMEIASAFQVPFLAESMVTSLFVGRA